VRELSRSHRIPDVFQVDVDRGMWLVGSIPRFSSCVDYSANDSNGNHHDGSARAEIKQPRSSEPFVGHDSAIISSLSIGVNRNV